MTVTVAAVTTITVTVTGSVGVTTFGRNIGEDDLHFLHVFHHFTHLLQGLFAEGFIGLHASDHEQTHVAMLNDRIGIRYQTDRRCIDYNIIVFLAQLFERICQFIRVNQLSRVRRDRTGTYEIEAERCVCLHRFTQVAVTDEEVRSSIAALQTKFRVDIRFTEVKVDQQGLLTGHRIQRSQVGRKEGLTITGLGGGHTDDHFLLALEYKLYTRTDST